jgi:hypothetical protein
MKTHFAFAALSALVVTTATGCRPAKNAEQMRLDHCEQHPESVALYTEKERPARPYELVLEVDATLFATPAGRSRTLRVKACRAGADAVIDASRGSSSPGRGLAIRYVDPVTTTSAAPKLAPSQSSPKPGLNTPIDAPVTAPKPNKDPSTW